MRLSIIILTMLTPSCAGMGSLSDDASGNPPAVAAAPAPNVAPVQSSSDLELRLAKLWSRVDELENKQIRQRERMKLLEKGLMLGIIPEELKGGQSPGKNHDDKLKDGDLQDPPASLKPDMPAPASNDGKDRPVAEKDKDIAEYRRLLQAAQAKFNAANYGQAIVHFNEIGERFDDSITEGNHHYWIGLSWFYLKEYQLAEQSFRKLLNQYNQNSWVPYSRFYLAKIDQNRGLTGRARDQFKLLIDEYPNQDLGEMARMEIDKMREKL